MQDAVAGVAFDQELDMLFAGVSLVPICIHLLLGIGQQFFQGLRVMFIAWGVVNGFDEAVLIHVDMRLIPVSTGLLAVGGNLDAVTGFAVLSILSVLAFAWTALLRFDNGGIDNADFVSLDIQAFSRQLLVNLG